MQWLLPPFVCSLFPCGALWRWRWYRRRYPEQGGFCHRGSASVL